MSRKAARQQVGVALFPFLAVLICTMGALIVLLVLLVQQARVDASTIAAQKIGLSSGADAKQLRERLEDAQWQRDLLEKSRAEKIDELAESRAKLAHLEEHGQRLQARANELMAQARSIDEGKKLRDEDLAQARDEVGRLKAEIDRKKKELEEAKHKSPDGKEWYALIPYEGPQGTRRRPIYIECTEFGVIIQPEGFILRAEDFNGPLGPGNPLDTALRAIREHLERTAGDKAGQPYPLLVVRPGGILAYSAARSAMKAWDDEFGYELISDEKQLDFGPADPALAARLSKTVTDARQRQAALIAMMPRRYQGDEQLKSFAAEPAADSPSQRGGGIGFGPGNGTGLPGGGNRMPGNGGPNGNGLGGSVAAGGGTGVGSAGGPNIGAGRGMPGGGMGNGMGGGGIGNGGMGGGGIGGVGHAGFAGGTGAGGNGVSQGGTGMSQGGASMSQGGAGGSFNGGGGGRSGNSFVSAGAGGTPGGGTGGGTGGGPSGNSAPGGFPDSPLNGDGSGGSMSGAGNAGATSGSSLAGAGGGSGGSGRNSASGSGGGATSGGSQSGGSPGASMMGASSMAGGSPMGGGGSPFSMGQPGMPSLNFSNTKNSTPGSTTSSPGRSTPRSSANRGKNWALPDARPHQIGVTRPIRIGVLPDRIIMLPEQGDNRTPQTVKIAPELTPDDVNHLVAAVQSEVKGWGLAVADGYWKPVLQADVAPDAERHFLNLQTALHGSGIDIVRR